MTVNEKYGALPHIFILIAEASLFLVQLKYLQHPVRPDNPATNYIAPVRHLSDDQ